MFTRYLVYYKLRAWATGVALTLAGADKREIYIFCEKLLDRTAAHQRNQKHKRRKMSARKRQRSDGAFEATIDIEGGGAQSHPPKKARKETNASARRSLFVRSLPAIATSEALTELFSQSYPLKHATVVIDPSTKQSKGYGFVTFADSEDAQRALDEFNGKNFMGRRMKIEIAQPRSRELGTNDMLGGKNRSLVSAEAAALKKAREEKIQEARKSPNSLYATCLGVLRRPSNSQICFVNLGRSNTLTCLRSKIHKRDLGLWLCVGERMRRKLWHPLTALS